MCIRDSSNPVDKRDIEMQRAGEDLVKTRRPQYYLYGFEDAVSYTHLDVYKRQPQIV